VNSAINRLYLGLLVLFALLVGFTSNWAVFDAEELEANTENKRPLLEQQQIARGDIRSSDGELIAVSQQRGKGESKRFVRDYPQGALFGNPVGYDFIDEGRNGIELSKNDVLVGEDNEFATLLEQLSGEVERGSDLTVTLDASAQQVALDQLGGRPGAVVAIEPSTGAVRVMASAPGYDPNQIPATLTELNQQEDAPLLNRSTQSTYPPGSTFKVVTAAAALDSGNFTPETTLDASSPQEFSGVDLANAGDAQYGVISMTDALTNSVNTYWAQVGEELGPETLIEYMTRFGFESDPELDYPDGQMTASGIFEFDDKGESQLVDSGFDIARVAIGQGGEEGQILATPLQMAQVAATVANDGVLMTPTFTQEVKDPDGRVSEELDPDEQSEVMSTESADQLAAMMTRVAEEGTASSLDLGGVPFAGKTGTAEKDVEAGINQVWFIGFAPVDDPQIAVAATVETCTDCFGGDTAGPIAMAVMQDLLE
jgi:peptidoglycan glycosyltransferase